MIETNVIQKRNKYHAQVSRLQEAFCCSASTIKMIKRCFLRRIRVQVRNVLFAGHVSPCPARTLGASLTREGCPGSRPTHGGSFASARKGSPCAPDVPGAGLSQQVTEDHLRAQRLVSPQCVFRRYRCSRRKECLAGVLVPSFFGTNPTKTQGRVFEPLQDCPERLKASTPIDRPPGAPPSRLPRPAGGVIHEQPS